MAFELVNASPSDRGPALSGLQFSEGTLAGLDAGLPEVVSPARDFPRTQSAGQVGTQGMLGLTTGLTALLSGYRSETPSSSARVEAGPSLPSPKVAEGQDISNQQMPRETSEASPVPDQQQPAPSLATPLVAGSAPEEGSGPAPKGPEPAASPASTAKQASRRKAAQSQPLPGVPPSQQNYEFLGKLSADVLRAQQPLPAEFRKLWTGRLLLREGDGSSALQQGVVTYSPAASLDPDAKYRSLFEGAQEEEELSRAQVQQMALNIFCWLAQVPAEYQIHKLLDNNNPGSSQALSKSPSKVSNKSSSHAPIAQRPAVGSKRKGTQKPSQGSQRTRTLEGPAFKVPYHRITDHADRESREARLARRANAATKESAAPSATSGSLQDLDAARMPSKADPSKATHATRAKPAQVPRVDGHGDVAVGQAAVSSEPCSRALGGAWQVHKKGPDAQDPPAEAQGVQDAAVDVAAIDGSPPAPATAVAKPAPAFRAEFAANGLAKAAAAGTQAGIKALEKSSEVTTDEDATTNEDGKEADDDALANLPSSHDRPGPPEAEAANNSEGPSSNHPSGAKRSSRKASTPRRANVELAQLGGFKKQPRKVASTATGEIISSTKTKKPQRAKPSKNTTGLDALTKVAERAGEQDSAADRAGAAALEGMLEGPDEGAATSPVYERGADGRFAPRSPTRQEDGAAAGSVGGTLHSREDCSQQAGPSRLKRRDLQQANDLPYVLMRQYADDRAYPASLCMAPGDIPLKDHVNAPFDAEQEIPVSHILDERITSSGNCEMLPKWQGYELDHNGWQPASTFGNTAALQAWQADRKGKQLAFKPSTHKPPPAPKRTQPESVAKRTSQRSQAKRARQERHEKAPHARDGEPHGDITLQALEEEPEFEIERILDHRSRQGKNEYLVKWKGYPLEEDGWEPEANLQDCKALDAFERSHSRRRR